MAKPWPLFTCLVLTLFVGTLMPGSLKAQIESALWAPISWSGLAHFLLFAAMAALSVYGNGRAGVWRAVLVGMSFACTTELLQSLVPGRHPLVHDVLLDMAGALAGLILRSLWLRSRRPESRRYLSG